MRLMENIDTERASRVPAMVALENVGTGFQARTPRAELASFEEFCISRYMADIYIG
jgi:hypothetical protein